MFHIKPAERNQIRLSGARLNLNRTVPPTQDSREAETCLLDNEIPQTESVQVTVTSTELLNFRQWHQDRKRPEAGNHPNLHSKLLGLLRLVANAIVIDTAS
ncbi:hypothetical protein C0Q70_17675 [Pomacea canaliculata]|uniref:Uncharacterized protein n=1 Tax=Pomacea canaliculata TaxID=400727 RepID=A0A2T7NL30_POMCA|nr:hypothetical protein C0Q70_17675 [Pomacea canaliculata]